jgi:tRNA (guanine-N7-)-methyltransferase
MHSNKLYGRRQGHKLRNRQARLMETLLPDLRITLADAANIQANDVWLEVGFGGGEHLAWQAMQNPAVTFIGCEPFINGIAKLLSQCKTMELKNIRIYDGDARDIMEVLPDNSISRAFVLFPDPWPKKRHHKRRFVCKDNLQQLARIMKPGAKLRIASDIPDYIAWTLEHINRANLFTWQAGKPDDWRLRPADWPPSRYEQKALCEGRTPVYLSFERS